jgi:hypothetical protein
VKRIHKNGVLVGFRFIEELNPRSVLHYMLDGSINWISMRYEVVDAIKQVVSDIHSFAPVNGRITIVVKFNIDYENHRLNMLTINGVETHPPYFLPKVVSQQIDATLEKLVSDLAKELDSQEKIRYDKDFKEKNGR